jgi:hypothetical protein
MNDRLLEILSARPDFSLSAEDKKFLDAFVEYLDRGSLFLSGFAPSENPVFIFTNEAQRCRFNMAEIRAIVQNLKQGRAMDWEAVPFEYVNHAEV